VKVLVTGSNGFVGRNLIQHLKELKDVEVVPFFRGSALADIDLAALDFIVHLAGVNRPVNNSDFYTFNSGLTQELVEGLLAKKLKVPLIFASSTQAELDNDYGKSKKEAEDHIFRYAQISGAFVGVYRLPNVFGKWCRPNYNSVVATFCHNVCHGKEIAVNDPERIMSLVYVDDVVDEFIFTLKEFSNLPAGFRQVPRAYQIKLQALADKIKSFKEMRHHLVMSGVGVGLERALYSTYLSYQPEADFSYPLVAHTDPRGSFVEILKTQEAGQFSFFTAHPQVTRGGHYHHSKNEKFVVVKGQALFRFKSLQDGREYEIKTSGEKPEVVETIPGWTHDITNIGEDEMIVFLWANEIFDRARPDTYAYPLPKVFE
jgi:UDP-2-acetamido-2,6-beta-L-arabino-hexul-4-ose reductase